MKRFLANLLGSLVYSLALLAKIKLSPWLLTLAARFQIRTRHRVLKMRSHHQLPPPAP